MKEKSELEQYRTRWFRWLGQMTRCDRDNWVELLDCNWSGWANKVLEKIEGIEYPRIGISSSKIDVYFTFRDAISEATMEELGKLDNIYCREVLLKR